MPKDAASVILIAIMFGLVWSNNLLGHCARAALARSRWLGGLVLAFALAWALVVVSVLPILGIAALNP